MLCSIRNEEMFSRMFPMRQAVWGLYAATMLWAARLNECWRFFFSFAMDDPREREGAAGIWDVVGLMRDATVGRGWGTGTRPGLSGGLIRWRGLEPCGG